MATSSSTSAVIERLSDRYEILHAIGQPFGYQQLLAQDIAQQRTVVIKSLTIDEKTPTGDICCFERETRFIKSLQHPTIPQYLASFSVETQPGKGLILVQTHSGGRTLAEQAQSGIRYCESDLKAIAQQLLQGLMYLHSKGLVHRDIKPSNIVMAGHESTVGQVSWLNLSTVQYRQAQSGHTLVGSYGYMAPEQVSGEATFASDLYSLGATLVYLVTGCHLGELAQQGIRFGSGLEAGHHFGSRFNGPCQTALKASAATMALSPSFQQWLSWLIAPQVSDRPASAKQALAALNHLPLAMLKRRLRSTQSTQLMPVPIQANPKVRDRLYFTKIRETHTTQSLALMIPPVGLRSSRSRQAVPPLLMGGALVTLAVHLLSLLQFSPDMLSSVTGMVSLAAACLALVGLVYGARFLRSGWNLLARCLLRQVHIELKSDVLLIAYKYWLRSPVYVVNTKRADIYNISALPDGGVLRILTHHNRTMSPCSCYKLAVTDGALSHRDIRWLNSLLNDWFCQK